MSELPEIFWLQSTGRLGLLDRMQITQLRTQMSERDRDLTNADIICLFTPEEIEARDEGDGRQVILGKLERALVAEALRGRGRSWMYSAARHERLGRLVKTISAETQKEKREAAAA